MKKLPVDKCIDVLDIFCAYPYEELWVNKIVEKVIKKTGSKDSPTIKKAIKLLEKAKILRSFKKGSQKTVKILTPFGIDIIDLVNNINSIHEKFDNLIKETKNLEKVIFDNEKIRKNKLRHMDWNEKDIDSFEDLINTFHFTIELYAKNIYNLLIYRYLNYITDPKLNDISKKILLTIITNELINQFDILKHTKSIKIVKNSPVTEDHAEIDRDITSHGIHESLFNSFFIQLNSLIFDTYQPTNQKIKNLLDDVYISMIQLTSADKKIHRTIINKQNKPIRISESNTIWPNALLTVLHNWNKISPYQKSEAEKQEDLRSLYEKTASTRKSHEIKEEIINVEDI